MISGFFRLVERKPRRLLLAIGVLLVLVLALGAGSLAKLTIGVDDYDDPSSAAVKVLHQAEAANGVDLEQGYVVLVRSNERIDPKSAQLPPVVRDAVAVLRSGTEVKAVLDYSSAADPAMVSADGRQTYLVAEVGSFPPGDAAKKAVNALQAAFTANPVLRGHVTLGGPTASNVEGSTLSSKDLGRAETIAFPILLILLLFIFRSVIAALIPLGGALTSVAVALGGMAVVMTAVHLSVFSLDLVLALGIGLSIDFSLLIISRFREELAHGLSTPQAVRRTMSTAGRTVFFSGMTVMVALACLLIFPQRFLYTMGVAGICTALGALFFGLVVLPALLSALGPRINKWAPRSWQRRSEVQRAGGRWYRFSHEVMRRPAAIAIGAAVILIGLGLPFLGIKFTSIDSASLPASSDSGTVYTTLAKDFPGSLQSPVDLITTAPESAAGKLATYAASLSKVEGVSGVTPAKWLGSGLWQTGVSLTNAPDSPQSHTTLTAIQAVPAPFATTATGDTALFAAMQTSIGSHLPLAVGVMALCMIFILFALTGSLVIPVKVLITDLLTLSATFGVLVFVFQDGHLSGLLKFQSQGALQPTMLVVILALTLGVSTDYSVFLLSRIKEGADAGLPNREAIATGLAKVGRTVTLAAILFCIPVGFLTSSGLVFIKLLGLGTALAVILDATVVRALLIPSLMVLLGRANWWAPKPLRRFHDRFLSGFRETAPVGHDMMTPAGKMAGVHDRSQRAATIRPK